MHLARNAGPIRAVAFTSDARFAVTAGETIRVWNIETRKLVRSFAPPQMANRLVLDEQRGVIIVSGWSIDDDHGYEISVLELESGRVRRTIERTSIGLSIVGIWAAQDGVVASYSSRGEPFGCRIWDVDTGRLSYEYPREVGDVGVDGRSAVGANVIWDLTTGRIRGEFVTSSFTWGVAVSRDGSRAVSQRSKGPFLWNDQGRLVRELNDQRQSLWRAAFSPDDRFLLTTGTAPQFGSNPRALILRDAHTGESLANLAGHRASIPAVAWTRDGQRAISGDLSGNLFLWTMPES